ncbi:MAG: TldD/PmbA family protein [Euryarchaeota archaeon]|nr:TldD/PmbA family protein [Euryarchaeota archaeon]
MSELLSLCEKAVGLAQKKGADEAEAYGIDQKETEVALERNDLKLCKSQLRTGIGLRVLKAKRLGFASVNSLDVEKIEKLAQWAVALASKAPKDKYNALPAPKPIRRVADIYDKECEAQGSDAIFEQATEMLRAARGHDRRVVVDGGLLNGTVGERAIFSSHGIQASERESLYNCFLIAFARDGQDVGSFDHIYEGAHRLRDIDGAGIGLRLAKRVVKSLGAKRTHSFKGTVLMAPSTVQAVLTYTMESSIDANNVQKGMSKFAGKIGKPVGSALLNVVDDGTLPGGLGSSSFDREGLPHKRLPIISKGTLRAFIHNSYTATKGGCPSTGHAYGAQRNVLMIGATNFIVMPGRNSKNDLIGETKKGVLVTRFSGSSETESGDFSGVVKGGFLIENGEITRPLKETLIAGNSFDLLNNLSGVSKDVENSYNHRLPYMRFEGVTVTGG